MAALGTALKAKKVKYGAKIHHSVGPALKHSAALRANRVTAMAIRISWDAHILAYPLPGRTGIDRFGHFAGLTASHLLGDLPHAEYCTPWTGRS
jgi:hypothetical protein